MLILDNIGQGVLIQHFQEGLQRLTEHRFQATHGGYLAGVLGGKALHDAQVLFGFPYQDTNVNIRGRPMQTHSTLFAPDGFNVALLVQLVHHLHEVVFGNVIAVSDFLNGRQTITLNRQIYQYSK